MTPADSDATSTSGHPSRTVALDTAITAVTVFADRAQVVRSGRRAVDAGRLTLLIERLPASLDPQSVRVKAGGAGTTLLEIEVRRAFAAEPANDAWAALRTEVDQRRETLQELDDREVAEQRRLDFLGALSDAAGTALARSVARGQGDFDDVARMADHVAATTEQILTAKRRIASERQKRRRELEAAEKRLADVTDLTERMGRSAEHTVAVSLDVSAAGEVALEVTYHVLGPSWQPLYDLRMTGSTLGVGYLAEIRQRSGEDWPAVALVLSTSRPGRLGTLPELSPWFLSRAVPPAWAAGSRMGGAGPVDAVAPTGPVDTVADTGPMPLALPPMDAAVLMAEPTDAGAAVSYRVPRPLPVPSDGSPHKVTVATFELDAELDHVAVPKLVPEVHLRAKVVNSSDLLLLPGPAQVFRDSELVAATHLDLIAPGEDLEVYLGTDDRVRIERELVRRTSGKALLGGTRSIDIAYETSVHNHRDQRVRVSVHDQVPIAREADIKVRLREATPKPDSQDDLGEMTWKIGLEAGATAVVRFAFSVEHPASVRLPV